VFFCEFNLLFSLSRCSRSESWTLTSLIRSFSPAGIVPDFEARVAMDNNHLKKFGLSGAFFGGALVFLLIAAVRSSSTVSRRLPIPFDLNLLPVFRGSNSLSFVSFRS